MWAAVVYAASDTADASIAVFLASCRALATSRYAISSLLHLVPRSPLFRHELVVVLLQGGGPEGELDDGGVDGFLVSFEIAFTRSSEGLEKDTLLHRGGSAKRVFIGIFVLQGFPLVLAARYGT
ncbi:hypothetical protein QYE76_069306 [Lolium multiflorum]|uniref:Uncharacterized protein n=1 Tax=Lolium multiflorum TaxID=4521 RepID=A0AAD8SG20_LOLMU|nr:hypothetical protein QYE76_069306 [Lolium multiflorum]